MTITILPGSHTDHNMTAAQREWALNALKDRTGFFIETLTLPVSLGTVPCGLYGPIMGDDPVPESNVHYAVRGKRPAPSRMIDLPERPCRQITVIAGPSGGDPCCLYTMFGGPSAPREPSDAGLKTDAEKAEAQSFWAQHALSAG